MGAVDIAIVAVVLVLVALAIRSVVRSNANGCSDCGSRGSCAAHAAGGTCTSAQRMLRDAERALGDRR